MSRRTPPPRPTRRNAPRVRRAPSTAGRRTPTRSNGRRAAARPPQRNARRHSRTTTRTATRSRPAAPPRARQRREITLTRRAPEPDRRHTGVRRSVKRRVVAPKPSSVKQGFLVGIGSPAMRLRLLLVLLLAVLGTVLYKVGRLQSTDGDELRAAGAEQWERVRPLAADRGTIFDRNGEELAVSIPAYSISVNPKLVTDEEGTARVLQSTMGLDDVETQELFDALVRKETGFRYVQRQVDASIGEQLAAMRLTGVNVDAEDRRVLPGGDTGRSVIGRTDIDGTGIAGLESQFDEFLTGTPGSLRKEIAPGGRSVAGTEQLISAPVPGNDIVLTLDRSIQFAAEEALVQRVGELGAQSGTIIIMDTPTGDVLGMASVQRNDEDVVEITSGNYAAVAAYEPGSVAKVVTVAASLNQGVVTPDSTFVVPWRKQYADDILSDSHQHPDELMTVEQILVESSNIGTIMLQQEIGGGHSQAEWDMARQTHWEYLRRFGFGERTALEFPDESPGILKHWTDLWGSERVTVSYGQGFAATSIQMATAINAIANDGVYVEPRLVAGTIGPDGELVPTEPSASTEIVRPDVAEQVQGMMRQVVCRGTGKRAQDGLDNFTVAGKTGTGLKAQPNGTYLNEAGERVYYASFVGFFPAEDPQITVLVSIDEPPAGDINRFGGTAAAPVFRDLVPTIAHEAGIQPAVEAAPCPAAG